MPLVSIASADKSGVYAEGLLATPEVERNGLFDEPSLVVTYHRCNLLSATRDKANLYVSAMEEIRNAVLRVGDVPICTFSDCDACYVMFGEGDD